MKASFFLITSLLIGVIIILSSCQKFPKGTPKCIREKIKEDNRTHSCLEAVYEYDYRGQKVYYFIISNCPDAGPFLLDKDCHFLCETVVGQWDGNDTSFCNNFFKERTNEKLIWHK